MKSKKINLTAKKNGKGYITSYVVNIGSAEARILGITDGTGGEIEKIIDEENHQIILRACKK